MEQHLSASEEEVPIDIPILDNTVDWTDLGHNHESDDYHVFCKEEALIDR